MRTYHTDPRTPIPDIGSQDNWKDWFLNKWAVAETVDFESLVNHEVLLNRFNEFDLFLKVVECSAKTNMHTTGVFYKALFNCLSLPPRKYLEKGKAKYPE